MLLRVVNLCWRCRKNCVRGTYAKLNSGPGVQVVKKSTTKVMFHSTILLNLINISEIKHPPKKHFNCLHGRSIFKQKRQCILKKNAMRL